MSLKTKLAVKLKCNKSGESASSMKVRSWTIGDSRPSLNQCITNITTGTFTILILSGLALVISFGLGLNVTDTHAASSSITVTIDDNAVDLNVAPTGQGAFSKSSASTIGVSTTNYTGYTLSITADSSSSNPTALINGSDHTKTLSSIGSALTEAQFKALDATSYNNMWGYLPSNLCTTTTTEGVTSTTCTTNTSFLPSPTTDGDTLDITSAANTTVNEYELTLGARVDTTAAMGSYSNTFVIYATANAIPYTITYLDNVVSSMPTDVSGETEDSAVTISSNTPTRNGYTFIGWCTVTPTHNANGTDTCSGTTVAAGGTLAISQTASANNFTLYAMWSGNYTIEGMTYLQDFASLSADGKDRIKASMVVDTQYQLTDRRDSKKYWIAKLADGNIWMTQALDLDLRNGTSLNHSTSDIGWSEGNTSKTWNPQSTANTINFEGGSGTTVSGWTNDNNVPYSASPYYSSTGNDVYVLSSGSTNADTVTNLSGCTGTGKSEAECQHYKVGNYYNFAAATATNSVSTTVGHTISDNDNGYVLPDSICPAGWRLPHGITGAVANNMIDTTYTDIARENNSEFDTLLYAYSVSAHTGASRGKNVGYGTDGLNKVRIAPLYFVRSGTVSGGTLFARGTYGYSWSSTISATSYGYYLDFGATSMYPAGSNSRFFGFPVRCLVR